MAQPPFAPQKFYRKTAVKSACTAAVNLLYFQAGIRSVHTGICSFFGKALFINCFICLYSGSFLLTDFVFSFIQPYTLHIRPFCLFFCCHYTVSLVKIQALPGTDSLSAVHLVNIMAFYLLQVIQNRISLSMFVVIKRILGMFVVKRDWVPLAGAVFLNDPEVSCVL
jgi:hypothetical protein